CTAPAPQKTTKTPKYPPRGVLPPSVDLRAMGLDGPVKDQAQVGMCWAFATSTVAENSLRRTGASDVVSATHILAAYSDHRLHATDLKGTPIVSDSAWPYYAPDACQYNDVTNDVWC